MSLLHQQLNKLKGFARHSTLLRKKMLGVFAVAFLVFTGVLAPAHIDTGDLLEQAPDTPFTLSIAFANDDDVLQVPASTAGKNLNGKKQGSFCGGSLDTCMAMIVYWFAVGIPSAFIYIASAFLSIAVKLSLDGATYGMGFVTVGWEVSRDLANMAFLFILIYIAFTIMLNVETGSTLQTLAWVIVIALLVNFSFFFSRVVIDASNIVALQFYKAIPDAPPQQEDSFLAKHNIKDLSASIMESVNPQNFLGGEEFEKWSREVGGNSNFSLTRLITLTVLFIAMGIIIITLGIAFFMAGIHFLGRIAMLWLLIVVSPLAFVAQALPAGKNYFSKWRDMLFKNAFYPAFFLFVFLFLSVFVRALTGKSGADQNLATLFFAQMTGASATQGGIAENFLLTLGGQIAIIAIIAGLIIILINKAMEAGDAFGLATSHAAGRVSGWLNKNVMGNYKNVAYSPLRGARWGARFAGGFAYQQTVGRRANKLGKALEGTGFGRGRLGWALRQDVLKPIEAKKVGAARSFTDWKEEDKKRKAADVAYTQKSLNLEEAARYLAIAQQQGPLTGEQKADRQRIEARVKNLNVRELEDMHDKDKTILKNPAIAGLLSAKQIEGIRKSDKISDADSEKISTEWHKESQQAPLADSHKIIDTLRKIHTDLQKGGVVISSINPGQMSRIDSTVTTNMIRDLKAESDKTRAEIAAAHNTLYTLQNNPSAPQVDVDRAKQALTRLNAIDRQISEGLTEASKLKEKAKDIPAGIGGADTSTGEFLAK